MYQLKFGKKLQTYPRITHLLKSYEAGYVRKSASAFTKEQILSFLKSAPDTGEYLHIKAAIVIGFCGGLRCADLIKLDTSDFEFNDTTGMWITYRVSKLRGESITNKFIVPLEYCQYLERYDHRLDECGAAEGRAFKTYRVRKNSNTDDNGYYTKQPMGIHQLSKFTVKVAEYLQLPNPSTYTGHSLRRSTANVMAEAGASTSLMKKHFNWKSESTSLKYVDNTTSGKVSIANMMKSLTSSAVASNKENVPKSLSLENCHNIVINF